MTFTGSKQLLCVLSLSLVICCVNVCSSYELPDVIVSDNQVANKWVKASYDFDNVAFPQKDVVIKLLTDTLQDPQLKFNQSCVDALKVLRTGLLERKLWAYKFLDSSAKGKSGLAYGYLSDLGHYDQCLSIKVNENVGGKRVKFNGQYCLAKLTFPSTKKPEKNFLSYYRLNLSETELKGTLYEYYGNHTEFYAYETFTFALCVPSTCSREEMEQIVEKRFRGTELKGEMRRYCAVEQDMVQFLSEKPLDQLICVFLLVIFTALIIIATLWTTLVDGNTFLKHFCARINTLKLSSDYKDPSLKKLDFLDVFKFWYHMGACYGHYVGFLPVIPLVHATITQYSDFERESWTFSAYAKKAMYTTQVIFLISGFFASYYMFPIISKAKGKLSFASFAFKRWLRTAPTTAGIFILFFGLTTFFHGPVADEVLEKHHANCRKDWWKTILYINNWQTFNDICIPQTWTQSVDFQLWLLSYFPLIWLVTNPRRGVISCLAMIALGIIIPVSVVYYYDLPSHHSGGAMEYMHFIIHGEFFPYIHFHTYNNLANYFIGILIGYACITGIKPKSQAFWYIGQVAIGALFLGAIFSVHIWTEILGFTWTRTLDLIYAGTFRICYASIFGFYIYGSFWKESFYAHVTKIVHKPMAVMGRLGFSMYLSHLIPTAFVFSTSYEYVNVNIIHMSVQSFSTIILCWIVGYYAFLLFEGPFISLSKVYTNRSADKSKGEMNNTSDTLKKTT